MAKASSSRSTHPKRSTDMPLQILPTKYLDESKLYALLEKTFGAGRYKMQVKKPRESPLQ
jgi:hypothetical protein